MMAHLLGDLIQKLKYQLKLTSVVVTHDMALAKKLADKLIFLARRASGLLWNSEGDG